MKDARAIKEASKAMAKEAMVRLVKAITEGELNVRDLKYAFRDATQLFQCEIAISLAMCHKAACLNDEDRDAGKLHDPFLLSKGGA